MKLSDNELASGSKDKSIRFWNWREGNCFKMLSTDKGAIFSLEKITHTEFASGDGENYVKIWR
jgi:hypothetical protein